MRFRPPHVPGGYYHVMQRGNRKQPIFADDRDRRYLGTLVGKSIGRYASSVHAYCWMTNHVHLLVRVGKAPLYRTMHYFATMYAKYFNKRYGFVGHLFQGRYRARYVDSNEYMMQLLRYIHRNPVEAGMVDIAEAYPWSSMRAYVGRERVPWLTTTNGLALFGYDTERFRRFVHIQPDEFDPWEVPRKPVPQGKREMLEAPIWRDLDDLLDAACKTFNVSRSELESRDTNRRLTQVRCWIGHEAMKNDVASLREVARRLKRSPAALSKSIQRNSARC